MEMDKGKLLDEANDLVTELVDGLEDADTEIKEIIFFMENRGENATQLRRVRDIIWELEENANELDDKIADIYEENAKAILST